MNKKYAIWIGILLFLIAFCARLVPLQFSNLPYNIDGFPLARISEIMIGTGGIPGPAMYDGLLSYNMKMPVFSLVLSTFSLVLGVQPLDLLPYFCALMGSLAVIFIYVMTLDLTKNDVAAFSAGLFAALTGLFVYVTTAAMKQLLAIVLLCFMFYLYTKRKDWRFRLALVMTLILLPFTHHLTTLIALLAISFAMVGTTFRRSEEHVRTVKGLILDLITGPVILLISLIYYQTVNLEFVSTVANLNDVMLLASVFMIMAVFARLLSITVQTKPWFFFGKEEDKGLRLSHIFDEKVLVLVIGIGVLYLNSRLNIFTGGQMTSDLLLKLMFPYLVLAVIAVMGFNVLRYSRFPKRYLLVGMFLAPFCVMIFSMLRGLDVFGFLMVYRSYNFIDIPLAIVTGVGMAYLYGRVKTWAKKNEMFRALPAFSMIIFFIFCAASLPLAYNNEEAFDVQEVTQDYEFNAMEWTANANISSVVTDQRYGAIISPYFDIQADWAGPWKMNGGGLRSGDVILTSWYWTDGGAQMYPLGRVTIGKERMDQLLNDWDVIYVGGPPGREMVIAVVP